MAKKRKKKKAKPKIEQVKTEPELTLEEKAVPVQEAKPEQSETPIIEGKQATAPVPETDESKPDLPSPKSGAIPPISEWPTIERPKIVQKEPWRHNASPPPPGPVAPGICAGCKRIVESDTTRACLNPDCKGSLVFCPACAKPGSCHKCGKSLEK